MKKMLPLFLAFLLLSCGSDQSNSEENKVHADSTRIAGHIENFSLADSISEIKVYVIDVNQGYLDYKTTIDSLGKFDLTIPINRQQDVLVSFKTYSPIIVEGGGRIELTLNAKDSTNVMTFASATFKGDGDTTNTLLYKYLAEKPFDSRAYFNYSQNATTSKFISYKDSIEQKISTYINDFEKNNDVPDALKNWILVDKEISPLERILGYPMNLRMFQKEAQLAEIPDSFFEPIKELPKLSEKHLINSSLYGSFGNYYTYHIADHIRNANSGIEPSSLDSLVIHSFIENNKTNPLLAQIAVNEKLNAKLGNNDVDLYEAHESVFSSLFKGSVFENVHSKKVTEIKQRLANPILPAKAKLLTFETEDTSKYLEEIIENANGKVIYVDNWATWCAPCKIEFKNSTPALKEKFGNEVEFVYLCFRSKEELYKPTISEFQVEGKHYYVPDGKEEAYFDQIKLKGFPTYLIINKEGEIVKNGFEYRPSFPETTEILTQLVAE